MFDVQEEEEEESDDEDDAFGPKKNKEEEDEDPVARKLGGRLGKSPESKVGFTKNSKTTMYFPLIGQFSLIRGFTKRFCLPIIGQIVLFRYFVDL